LSFDQTCENVMRTSLVMSVKVIGSSALVGTTDRQVLIAADAHTTRTHREATVDRPFHFGDLTSIVCGVTSCFV
jgi:hypothetical protein